MKSLFFFNRILVCRLCSLCMGMTMKLFLERYMSCIVPHNLLFHFPCVEGVMLVEDDNNTDLLNALDDARKLLSSKYLKQVELWIEVCISSVLVLSSCETFKLI